MDNFNFLVAAYILFWTIPFIFLALIFWKTRQLESEISKLSKELEKSGS